MCSKLVNKTFNTKIKEDYDVIEGYIRFIELPEELCKELNWEEGDRIELTTKLGPKNNVIVVNKA
jgi:formylmethanofuran dehydrogenase subunit D